MKPDDLFEYYNKMLDSHILISFKGAISQEILVELAGFIRQHLGLSKSVKRVFAIFVEMTQNVLHHSMEKKDINQSGNEVGVGVIEVMETAGSYCISSGNRTDQERCHNLIARCKHINSLRADELKVAYKEQRRMHSDENSCGAGLGLLDIARKSDTPLEYAYRKFDDDHCFFVLTAKVSKGS